MDKQPVGQLPDLTQSNNDDEIMVITNDEYNQLKKEKISDFITDLTSTNENNALTKGTDGKMFVTDFGNASNITEGTLPTSVLPEIPLEKIPDIPKDKLPQIETADLPVSGVTADTYAYPSSVTVNAQGQVTAIEAGEPGANNANQDLSNISEAGKEVIRETAGTGLQLFDLVVKDHILTEQESVGFALLGTYVTKAAYLDFHNTCVSEKTAGTPTQTTLGDSTITTYNNANGHIFYDIADKAAVDAFYNTWGVAWFYGVDTENEQIFLPRNNWFFQSGNAGNVGKYVEAGLPNITGSIYRAYADGDSASSTGALQLSNKASGGGWGPTPVARVFDFNLDASRSNAIYGRSNTVQPPAVNSIVYMVVGNTVINSDQALIDAQGLIAEAWDEVDDKVNDGLAALAGASNALTQNQITNCLLEVPQRVKVEINGSTLTLKAGSVVIVPYGTSAPTMEIGDSLNGGEIFDISWDGSKLFYFVKYASDKENNITDINTQNRFVFVNSAQYFDSMPLTRTFSSPTAPSTGSSQWALWYDTTNNNVKYTNNSGTNWIEYCSLPFATGVNGPNGWESIQNIFNGFGFIGSTIWCDKGVKGLAPDGRNADGSLKNMEIETEYVTTNTRTWTVGAGQTQYATLSAATKGINAIIASYYFEQEEKPDITGHVLWFNTRENVMYWQNNDNVWTKVNDVKVFNINNTSAYTDGKIDNISEVKQVFRAADYSAHPQITETYSNGESWYRVYSDGWCEQGGRLNTTGTTTNISLIKPYPADVYTVLATDTGTARVSYGIRRSTGYFIVYSASSGNSAYWTAKGYLN